MARKTNKTSHVLNLITNGAPAEPETKARSGRHLSPDSRPLRLPLLLFPAPPERRW